MRPCMGTAACPCMRPATLRPSCSRRSPEGAPWGAPVLAARGTGPTAGRHRVSGTGIYLSIETANFASSTAGLTWQAPNFSTPGTALGPREPPSRSYACGQTGSEAGPLAARDPTSSMCTCSARCSPPTGCPRRWTRAATSSASNSSERARGGASNSKQQPGGRPLGREASPHVGLGLGPTPIENGASSRSKTLRSKTKDQTPLTPQTQGSSHTTLIPPRPREEAPRPTDPQPTLQTGGNPPPPARYSTRNRPDNSARSTPSITARVGALSSTLGESWPTPMP